MVCENLEQNPFLKCNLFTPACRAEIKRRKVRSHQLAAPFPFDLLVHFLFLFDRTLRILFALFLSRYTPLAGDHTARHRLAINARSRLQAETP